MLFDVLPLLMSVGIVMSVCVRSDALVRCHVR